MIREVQKNDLDDLLKLYMQLHDNPFPEINERILSVWESIINDKNHHIIVAEEERKDVGVFRLRCKNLNPVLEGLRRFL